MTTHPVEHEHTKVVIVGSGPTGLTAAVRLSQLGVPHAVVDAAPGATATSKAAVVHAATIELFAELGLADDLVAAGRRIRRIVMVDRGRRLAAVPFDRLPSPYPFALGAPQSLTEGLLLRRLEDLGTKVRRRHQVATVEAGGDGYVVTGTAETVEGSRPFAVTAPYVIGADGAHSVVRTAIGLEFPGQTYGVPFALADVRLTAVADADDEAIINLSPRGVTVIVRLPSGNHRVVATVDPATEVPNTLDRAFLDALLRDRGIGARCAADPDWSSRFRVHHRVADRFRVGGVFLAGDAAHVHSPAAGQGMNTGIADAYDLGTRLAGVVAAGADATTLDGYEHARRPAALEVLAFTDRLTRMATLSSPPARCLRRVAMGTVGRIDPLQRSIATTVAGLRRSPLRAGDPTSAAGVARSGS